MHTNINTVIVFIVMVFSMKHYTDLYTGIPSAYISEGPSRRKEEEKRLEDITLPRDTRITESSNFGGGKFRRRTCFG